MLDRQRRSNMLRVLLRRRGAYPRETRPSCQPRYAADGDRIQEKAGDAIGVPHGGEPDIGIPALGSRVDLIGVVCQDGGRGRPTRAGDGRVLPGVRDAGGPGGEDEVHALDFAEEESHRVDVPLGAGLEEEGGGAGTERRDEERVLREADGGVEEWGRDVLLPDGGWRVEVRIEGKPAGDAVDEGVGADEQEEASGEGGGGKGREVGSADFKEGDGPVDMRVGREGGGAGGTWFRDEEAFGYAEEKDGHEGFVAAGEERIGEGSVELAEGKSVGPPCQGR